MRHRLFLAIVALVIIFIFLALSQFTPIFQKINGFFAVFTSPINQKISGVFNQWGRGFYLFFNGETILKENDGLRSDLRRMSVQLANLQMLAVENETLKKELNFISEKKYPYLVGEIIGRANDEGEIFLIINKGKKDGLVVGLPVVIDNGVLIGKIWKSEEKKSLVMLSFSSSSRLAATFLNHLDTSGLVGGERNLSLKMELIPKNIEIKNGDFVITSGLENLVPSGLIIGNVEQAADNQNDLFQTAYLKVPYSLSEIQIVTVLLPYEK